MGEEQTVDEAFYERNQAVFLLLALLQDQGHTVGYRQESDDDDWPVVFARTPAGEISWHVPRDELPRWLDECDLEWDGHDREEKHERMQELATYFAGEGGSAGN